MAFVGFFASILLPQVACSNLEPLPADKCGNFVIERGEDCDGAGIADNVCSPLCRLTCTDQGSCPDGWACGSDLICRQASGRLEPFGPVVPLAANRLLPADFDGDGKSDILAVGDSTFSIVYADPNGLSTEPVTFVTEPLDTAPDVPAAGDINGDGRGDLTLRFGPDLGVMGGLPDRTLLPRAFSRGQLAGPGQLIAANVDYRVEAPFSEIVLLSNDALSVVYSANTPGLPEKPLYTWLSGHGALVTSLTQSAELSSVLTFAFEGENKVSFFQPMTSVQGMEYQWNYNGEIQKTLDIFMPPGGKINGPVKFYNTIPVSQDPTLTGQASAVVVAGELNGKAALFACYSNPVVGFHSDPFSATPPGNSTAGVITPISDDAGVDSRVLGWMEVNDDQIPDFITEQGVFVSACYPNEICALQFDPANLNAGATAKYKKVVSADVGDRWVAAYRPYDYDEGPIYVASESSGLSTLLAVNDGFNVFYNTFRTPTRSQVRNLTFADLDGDLRVDALFTQISSRAPISDPPVESLHVAFSSADFTLGNAVDLGDLGQIVSIATTPMFGPGLPTDGISELVIRATVDGVTEDYLYPGRTDRQIQAPLSVVSVCTQAVDWKGAVRYTAIGRFANAESPDVAMLLRYEGDDGAFHHTLASVSLTSNLTSDICSTLSEPLDLPDFDSPEAAEVTLAAIDLDADGVDELLLHDGASGLLYLARYASGKWTAEKVETGVVSLAMKVQKRAAEAVVLLRTQDGITLLTSSETQALGESPVTLAMADLTCPKAGEQKPVGAPLDVAVMNLDADGEDELMVVTESDTILVDFVEGAPSYVCKTLELGGGGLAVTAADVNDDGLDDLMVSRLSGIQVLSGVPVLP
ncbi:MAG: VCBS repeat-containing protein [Polyangiaceae bacterium]|nr:VCBS repeat-containing protein [Polyangiaceae bacterium]